MTETRVQMKPEEIGGRGKMVDREVVLGAMTTPPMPILVVKCSNDITLLMEGLTRYCPLKSSIILRSVGVLQSVGVRYASLG